MSKLGSKVGSELGSSTAAAFERHLPERPDAPALRFKRYGRWLVWTWRTFDWEVSALARGLTAAGLRRGGRLWLVGAPSARQLALLVAAERLGGSVVTFDETTARAEIAARGGGAPPEIALVEDRDALDLLDGVCDGLLAERETAAPRVVIVDDPRGLRAASDPRLRSYESFTSTAGAPAEPGESRALRGPEPSALASGASSVASGDRALLLPTPWSDETRALVSLWIEASFTLELPERHGSLEADIREGLPTVLLGDASTIGALVDNALDRLPRPGTLQRRWLDRSVQRRERNGRWGALERELVLRPLRRALGLTHVRLAVTFGTALPAGTQAFLDALEIRTESPAAVRARGAAPHEIQRGLGSAREPAAAPAPASEPARGVA